MSDAAAFGPYADDHFHAVGLSARRKLGQIVDTHLAGLDVGQFAGIDIVEMVVRCRVGIVEDPVRIHDHFMHQTLGREQTQGIVDSSLGNYVAFGIDGRQDLLRGHVLRLREQQLGDLEALLRRLDMMGLQRLGDRLLIELAMGKFF